jgi:recombinational DNA repair protein (RecF pathway)
MTQVTQLTCCRCHKDKNPEEFHRANNRITGRNAYCKACYREYQKEHAKVKSTEAEVLTDLLNESRAVNTQLEEKIRELEIELLDAYRKIARLEK